jgi:3',5'-cyclic AMP phosphodiesterase CpdA
MEAANNGPTFIHISDTHIGPKGTTAYDTDTPANLRAVAQRIAEMELEPAFFVFSGDLSNHGEPESYAYLAEILNEEFARFGVSILMGLGNHDARVAFRQVILGETTATDENEPYYYSRRIGDLRVLMLDSKIPGRVNGLLGGRQLAWLEHELAEPARGGDVLVVHHPCIPRGVPRPDDYLLLDAEALAEVLARQAQPSVLAILCGHSHVSTASTYGGVLHVAAPATAYLLDPSIRDGGRGIEGAGFNICTVRGGRLVVNPVILPGAQRELYRHSTTFSSDILEEDATAPALGGVA